MNHWKKQDSEFIRLSDAARWLQVYPATLLRWADNGLIPAPSKLGACVLFKRQDLLDAITKNTGNTGKGGEAA